MSMDGLGSGTHSFKALDGTYYSSLESAQVATRIYIKKRFIDIATKYGLGLATKEELELLRDIIAKELGKREKKNNGKSR